jgi:hypothetical protein
MTYSFVPTAMVLLLVLSGASQGAQAQAGARTERVTFAKGASSAEIKGQVKGDEYVDYQVRAAAGQTLTVTLKPTNRSTYFNVNPPGSTDVSMFVGSTSGDSFKGMLPADGDYTVRVYLMRNAARRNEVSTYTLAIGVTGAALAPIAASKDALVPGTSYHATARITCTSWLDGKVQQCEAFVTRRGTDGTATVEVRPANGPKRHILFVKGTAVASDAPDPVSASRKGDLTIVSLGTDERYEIPDAFVIGG